MANRNYWMLPDGGKAFRSEILEMRRELIEHDEAFHEFCDGVIRPYLLEGKSVTLKVVDGASDG